MGVTTSRINASTSTLSFSLEHKGKGVDIPLSQTLNVDLAPRFVWPDRPGESVEHHLKLEFQPSDHYVDRVVRSQEDRVTNQDELHKHFDNGDISAKVELTECGLRETSVLFHKERRWKVHKLISWQDSAGNVTCDQDRLLIRGKLHRSDEHTLGKADMNYNLIFCTPERIALLNAHDWLVLGSLYVLDPSAKREYKWRAAISISEKKSDDFTEANE